MELTKLAGYVALSLPAIFIIGLSLVIHHNPWFSFTDNALSDMGSLENPARWWFNGFLMVFAIFTMVPSIIAFRNGLSYMMPIAAVFLFLVGVFPEETSLHAPSAVLFYLLALGDIAVMGFKLGEGGVRVGYVWSALAGVTFLLMLYLAGVVAFRGLAIPELVGATTILAWFAYLGFLLLRGFKL
ncbi:hypothetical protein A3L09_04660 [Thermococcus profundus]|uniref:DUF998 domain-containing protein n=1 Tax=Thermococcus profundus TaxID=49899 RepID=A0A2Z2M819_THEPR|nr:DUF998 domain-containing protein [Thermococcus profundus]ASJ02600.1 hypothetical protein A3L09_04660 [Thermococcus profundus]